MSDYVGPRVLAVMGLLAAVVAAACSPATPTAGTTTDGPSHTQGSITTGLIAKAAIPVAVGLTTFTATTAPGTGGAALKRGDILSIAGHTQTYALTADATQAHAAADVLLAFEPGLQLALVGGEAITLLGEHGTGCNTVQPPASAGGASIVQDAGESLQHKSWQPMGGEIELSVKSFVAIPADASVFTCFRWKIKGKSASGFIESPSRLDLSGDGKLLKVATTVPHLGSPPANVAKTLPLVELAEIRILAMDKENKVKADVTTEIGITHPVAAFALAIGTMILGFVVLYIAAARRLTHPGILQANWLLRIISTPSGFASLSQLQIVLWTFVVAVSAVYVMSLSGELIQITNGTLVLLGIAGATGIGAKAHNEATSATAEADAAKAAADKAAADIIAAQKAAEAAAATTPAAAIADPVAAARITAENSSAAARATDKGTLANAAKAKADALKDPPLTQIPRWSDLIVNESVKDDGTVMREIDVARFQMLLFTLITAAFVLMNVVTTYVIPEISTGFQTLMGISNGVYLGSKIAQGS